MTKSPLKDVAIERVRELLAYDPETGVLRWRTSRGKKVKAGDVAGCESGGYRKIKIDGRMYLAHRLAWVIVRGEWPEKGIDHQDLDGLNNRWKNLRPASPQQQCANHPVRKDSRTGIKGVRKIGPNHGWHARITTNGKSVHLGTFPTAQAASLAYRRAADELFGEFARAA